MAVDTKRPEQKPAEPKKAHIRAVFGDIIHPYTETRFTTSASKVHEVDSWITIQLEAGKIVVED